MSGATILEHALPLERLDALTRRWRRGEIGDACYGAQYLLYGQLALHGRRYASRRYRQDPRPDHVALMAGLERAADDQAVTLLCHFFERYGLLGVVPQVGMALIAWLSGRWPLTLRERIPSPEEMLRMQARGTRVVTVLSEASRLLGPVLNKPNAFAFMAHDLEHAYKFFHDPGLHDGQRRFYARVLAVLERGRFDRYRSDPVFAEKFAYLISDMNTHMMHSLQFLRAILIEHHLRAAAKQPREELSHDARLEVDAVMGLFDECVDAGLRVAGGLA